ncbi:MAG: hypothetical protein E7410_00870 [Ruminococcaceae bacterium]|nr:hypothetical protein [Oscillospiraceae bacterium]
MALKFGSSVPEKIYTADEFVGVDFTSEPSKLSPKRSPEAKNMLVNKNGYVEKRTGYRRVLEAQGNVNGIFEYVCAADSNTYHFAHIGTSLYKIDVGDDGSFTLGDELLTGLLDKKSRGFMFDSALYIIGARYIKIGYDDFSGSLCYGFVNEASTGSTEEDAPTIISGRTKTQFGGESFGYNAKSSYKKIEFASDGYGFNSKDKMYVAKPEFANDVRIASLYMPGSDGHFRVNEENYSVGTDEKGLYIELRRNSYQVEKAHYGTPYVIVQYDNFVYVPTVVINRMPVAIAWSGGGAPLDEDGNTTSEYNGYTGEVLEAVNLASRLRKAEFLFTGDYFRPGATAYAFFVGKSTHATRVWVNGELLHNYRDGANSLIACFRTWRGNNSCFEISMPTSDVEGVEGIGKSGTTVCVEYVADVDCDVIDKCSIYALYGGSTDTRVFVSGNEKYPSRDFSSGLFDATYFSDLGYTDVGAEESAIVGYHKLYGNLIIVKDGVGKDSAQYLRTFSLTNDENGNTTALFTVKQGNISYGAVNTSSFKSIGGVPLYLGRDGVFAISGTNVENQNNTSCVSHRINGRLLKHKDLENAVCASMGKRYYVFLDNCAYVCDAESGFEWFYFDSLPKVRCVWVRDSTMYFGSDGGAIYRFMSEDEPLAYYDNVAVDGSVDNARAIEAVWEIGATTLGEYASYKTIRNCYITCMPHKRSSVKVYYNTNEDYRDWVMGENIDLFTFDDVDFERFTFRTIQAPFVFSTGVKAKNVYVFGLRFVNDVPGEPFGFLAAAIKYRSGKYVK